MYRSNADHLLIFSTRTATVIASAVFLLIFGFLARESWPALSQVSFLRFFSDGGWHPASSEGATFGMYPMLLGTLLTSLGAVAIAFPMGVLCAIFEVFYAPRRVGQALRGALELLSGLPSVVLGLWALVTWVPRLGSSLLCGILLLALMIVPIVALMTSAALESVPPTEIAAARALGISRPALIFHVALARRKRAIAAAALLQLGRALGETMALLMITGNVVGIPSSIWDPVRTLAANIALEMSYATGNHRSALFVSGLVLLVIIAGLNFGGHRLRTLDE